jgi:hypothetical protein
MGLTKEKKINFLILRLKCVGFGFRNGNFRDSVNCLRNIYQSCKDPVKLEMLTKYADPDAWQAGFDRLCESMSRKYP